MDSDIQEPTDVTMPPISRGSIVAGIDGSYHGDECVAWAAEQARLEQRPLAILYSADQATAYTTAYGEMDAGGDTFDHATMMREVAAHAHRLVDDAAGRARRLQPALEVTGHYTLADARHALLDAAEKASLVVVGSRGRGPVGSLLLGSVSTALSRHAPCPVVVVRPGATDHAGGIVVGVDGRPESEAVLEFAFREASLRGRPLTAVHTERGKGNEEEEQRLLMDAVAGFQDKFPEVEVKPVVRHEDVDDALLGADQDASLIVVGRRHHSGPLAAFHRGVASTIIEHADTTVAAVPIA